MAEKRKVIEKDALRFAMVLLASLVIAFNIKSFVRAGNLFPGGFTGLSLLAQRSAAKYWGLDIPYTPINLLLNIGPIFLSWKTLGKKFTLYSCVVIILSAVFTDILPVTAITYDKPLISIFGGLINGAVMSFCLYANATTGGTDFIAVYFSEKKGLDAWDYIFIGNAVILVTAGALFGWDAALYSIIFQFTSTQVVHTLYRHYYQDTMLVITDKPNQVYEVIKKVTRHDATVFKGVGCYEKEERNMVYSVVSRDEVKKVTDAIRALDQHVFINVIRTEQVEGRFYHRPKD
ncbi:MAG: YitT family protein [bacterium]|nr:YitT family protein [bacterium]